MKISTGQTVLVTGATGGLGVHITRALAERKVKLALVAFPGIELEELQRSVAASGCEAFSLAADLRDPAQRHQLLDEVHRNLGEVDILINNAGVEITSAYHELTEENIRDIIGVNLEAPMVMTKLVLPEMVRRRSGHIINMASLAGKSGPAYQEPYAATKAGLIAFTASLRATYRRNGVSASVIVPGFVEAGIYAKLKAASGCAAPALLGTSPPEAVVRAVIRAIEDDRPEVIVNSLPVRPLLAFTVLFPRLGEWIAGQTGANDFFQRVVDAQNRNRSGKH